MDEVGINTFVQPLNSDQSAVPTDTHTYTQGAMGKFSPLSIFNNAHAFYLFLILSSAPYKLVGYRLREKCYNDAIHSPRSFETACCISSI